MMTKDEILALARLDLVCEVHRILDRPVTFRNGAMWVKVGGKDGYQCQAYILSEAHDPRYFKEKLSDIPVTMFNLTNYAESFESAERLLHGWPSGNPLSLAISTTDPVATSVNGLAPERFPLAISRAFVLAYHGHLPQVGENK